MGNAIRPTCWTVAGLILAPFSAHADHNGYTKTITLTAQGGGWSCVHRHDWSDTSLAARRRMIRSSQDPMGRENDFSYLECKSDADSRLMFRTPVPALTHLWISGDNHFIVGLSNVKLDNPIQMIVLAPSGAVVFRAGLAAEEACLSADEYRDATKRYPLQALAAHRIYSIGDRVFLDFRFPDSPRVLGDPLWRYLASRRCRSHWSTRIEESTTNWVDWFDATEPLPSLAYASDGEPIALMLRGNGGTPVRIDFADQLEWRQRRTSPSPKHGAASSVDVHSCDSDGHEPRNRK